MVFEQLQNLKNRADEPLKICKNKYLVGGCFAAESPYKNKDDCISNYKD